MMFVLLCKIKLYAIKASDYEPESAIMVKFGKN